MCVNVSRVCTVHVCVGPEVSPSYGLRSRVWFSHMLRTLMSWRHTEETKTPGGSPGETTRLRSTRVSVHLKII